MANAEMILKIVMSPIESPNDFVKQCNIRLPDLQSSEFQKILDMKVIFAISKIHFYFYYIFHQSNVINTYILGIEKDRPRSIA